MNTRYRARCPTCPWVSREYTRYTTAETAAKEHTRDKDHVTWVIDHYDLRVTGSTVRPNEVGL